jgi:hypothetical protein
MRLMQERRIRRIPAVTEARSSAWSPVMMISSLTRRHRSRTSPTWCEHRSATADRCPRPDSRCRRHGVGPRDSMPATQLPTLRQRAPDRVDAAISRPGGHGPHDRTVCSGASAHGGRGQRRQRCLALWGAQAKAVMHGFREAQRASAAPFDTRPRTHHSPYRACRDVFEHLPWRGHSAEGVETRSHGQFRNVSARTLSS